MKGKSKMANSLTCAAKMPEFMAAISKVPPWMADTLAWSLPKAPPGNTLTLILPPEFFSTISLNFSMPSTMG